MTIATGLPIVKLRLDFSLHPNSQLLNEVANSINNWRIRIIITTTIIINVFVQRHKVVTSEALNAVAALSFFAC